MRLCLTLIAGAVLLAWPAFLNGYPLLFSDTGGLMEMALLPDMGWDKPWVYGPFLLAFHGLTTLWLPALAQCLMLSWLLWTAQCAVRPGSQVRHLALCVVLAAASAAPWFAPLLMPDIFAPMTVLSIFILGFGQRLGRLSRALAACIGVLAVAVHLAHLILAAGCLAVVWLLHLRGRRPWWRLPDWRPGVPLAGALVLLLLTNLIGNGVLGVSPYGSVFMLARMVADGPAARVIDQACPTAGWRVCGWAGRLPTDSDEFLWHPEGPVWANNKGPIALAPEASRIVMQTVRTYPVQVAQAMAANAWRQLFLVRVGDALGPDYLDATVLNRLRKFFPAEEVRRYQAALQPAGRLKPIAEAFGALHLATLGAGLAGTLVVLLLRWRDRAMSGLCVLVLAALVANAFATGALSGPHHRYQARLAWLLLLAPVLAIARKVPDPDPDRGHAGRDPKSMRRVTAITTDSTANSVTEPASSA